MMRLFYRSIKSIKVTLVISLVLLLSSCTFIIDHLPFNFFLNSPEIVESYVTENDGDLYLLNLKLKNIKFEELTAITIENEKYQNFNLVNEDNNFTLINFYFEVDFNEEEYLTFTIQGLVINEKLVNLKKDFVVYKSIDNNLINLKKQSVVGIYSPRARTWGSGVVIKEQPITKNNQRFYEYYILTNYHVIKDARGAYPFEIVYDNLDNKLTEGITLVSYEKETADLALLKVITSEQVLTALDDNQLKTYIPVDYAVHDPVFAIGSPSDGNSYDFNQVKGGYILKLDTVVVLKDDKSICKNGCHALQTSAIQGKGSSGGGVFDRNGNLIGLHFAGNDQDHISSEIPIKNILKFLRNYFESELVLIKKGEFSPFILLGNQLQ